MNINYLKYSKPDSLEFICWNCGYFWISDKFMRCPDCDSGNLSCCPYDKRQLILLKHGGKI